MHISSDLKAQVLQQNKDIYLHKCYTVKIRFNYKDITCVGPFLRGLNIINSIKQFSIMFAFEKTMM